MLGDPGYWVHILQSLPQMLLPMGCHVLISDVFSRDADAKLMPSWLRHRQSPWPNVGSLHWGFAHIHTVNLTFPRRAKPYHMCTRCRHQGFAKRTAHTLLTLSMCSGNNGAQQEQPKGYHMYWNARQIPPDHNVYPERTNGIFSKRLPPQTPMSKSVRFCFCFMYFYNSSFWRLLQGLTAFMFKTFL